MDEKPDPAKPRQICALRLSALGDIVLLVPALRALARHLPDARISWITSPQFEPVLQGLPANIRLEPVGKPSGIGGYAALRRRFAGQNWDVLLAMQASLRANLIYPLLSARRKIGYDTRRARDGQGWFVDQRIEQQDHHLADGFLAFVQLLGVRDAAVEWKLKLDPAAQEWAHSATQGRPYIVINPCASKLERSWPAERNAALARAARERLGIPVVLCGGNSEAEQKAAAFVTGEVPGVINLCGQTSLPQLFALLAGARALVSPDSGPVHIARAFDVPVVGLYAVARPELSGPYRALQWTVNRYPDAVRAILKKDPENVDWHQRVHSPLAMQLIEIDEVYARLADALASR